MADSNATKNALAASMKKLMIRRPFEKISVSDICNDCGINRKSFYYHFRDKYDLVNWIFYTGFVGEVDLFSYKTGWDLVEDICTYFYREKEFYRAALRIEGQNSFRDYLIEVATPVVEFFLKDVIPENESDSVFATFITDGFLTALIRWLSGGYHKEMDASQFVAKMKQIIVTLGDNLHQEAWRNTQSEKRRPEGSI